MVFRFLILSGGVLVFALAGAGAAGGQKDVAAAEFQPDILAVLLIASGQGRIGRVPDKTEGDSGGHSESAGPELKSGCF